MEAVLTLHQTAQTEACSFWVSFLSMGREPQSIAGISQTFSTLLSQAGLFSLLFQKALQVKRKARRHSVAEHKPAGFFFISAD